ncbi:protein SSUH2 homolog [Ptychodera flava]|uniref:protein SSUH2 homolog n=1 Tax=Ptychodera flava TaxID=63121 RepID=UPI00396A5123
MERASAYEIFGAPVPPPEETIDIELTETDSAENGLYTPESSAISEEEAKAAFMKYVQRHRLYGTGVVRQCTIDSIRCVDAFHYMLETFTESRSTRLVEKPFEGDTGNDDDVNDDTPKSILEPWDVSVEPHKYFEDDSAHIRVPNSEQTKSCPSCLGVCKVTCSFCGGTGSTRCLACGVEDPPSKPGENGGENGGIIEKGPCQECNGTGRKGCSPCSESGDKACSKCNEKGKLKCHVELIVQWKNNWDDFIVDYVGAVPEKVLRRLQGKIVIKDEKRKLSPLSNFPNVDINAASKELIENHHSEYSSHCKILKQRHQVRVIPISDVRYTWKNKNRNFFVFGENHDNVYAPNYPQRYLCCNVM